MVFKRREERTSLQKIREMIWPSMGWMRAAKYVRHRLIRLPDSTHKVALSLAIGTGVSFSPLMGTHFVQSMGLAYVMRCSPVAAFIGTAAGNPWTFPFIWWSGYSLGFFLFETFGWRHLEDVPEEVTFGVMWEIVKTHPLDIFLPWMLGGTLMGLAAGLISYYIYYGMIKAGRAARIKVVEAKAHMVAKEVTGQKK